jgi:Flp pilus assembly protein TadD
MKDRLQNAPTADDYTDLGVWFAGHDQYDCAADAFATALQAKPPDKYVPHLIFMFGSSLYLSGDLQEAIPALQEAEHRGYKDNRLHLMLAAALDALSTDLVNDADYPSVIELLDKPRVQPQRTPTQCANLATAYERTGKPGQALEVLRNGLNTSPESAEVAGQLAALLVRSSRDEEAASVLEIALTRNPDDPRLHEAFGTVLARLNRMPEAREHLERAIALGDTSPDAKSNLAKVIQALGAAPQSLSP